ncbi:alkaline shock response membrane anchor protein AmaP [uncultured Jatrophihabitans sp.]|uniref:alkaline shock response membrane anchor protein AmaP n=1 Tax=uncultured Jatrophihabitans sp. TaxID=1610747 RepID=UPI0035CAEED3
MHADRTNRTALVILALLLIAGGGAGAAASFGVFGRHFQHASLVHNSIGRFVGRNGAWFWWAAAGVALVLVLLTLRWLLALLFSTDRTGDVSIKDGGGSGRTTLAAGAVTDAVVGEIESLPGVDSAKARLIGDPDDPSLVVDARVRHDADLADLRKRIVGGPIAHARTSTGRTDLPVRLDLVVSAGQGPRVS